MIMPLTCQNSRAQGRRRDCTQCTGRQCTQCTHCTGIRFWSGGQWPSVMQCPAQWRHSTWLPAHNTPLWLQAQYHSHQRVQRADTCLWRWQSDNQGTKWMLTPSGCSVVYHHFVMKVGFQEPVNQVMSEVWMSQGWYTRIIALTMCSCCRVLHIRQKQQIFDWNWGNAMQLLMFMFTLLLVVPARKL